MATMWLQAIAGYIYEHTENILNLHDGTFNDIKKNLLFAEVYAC
jgi:hypothetical protein